MDDEYKILYENGPIKVGLVLVRTQGGSYRGDSGDMQFEGILSGETETNLVFDRLVGVNIDKEYMKEVDASKSLIRKQYIAVIYQIDN